MKNHIYTKYVSLILATSLLMPIPAQAGIWDYAQSATNRIAAAWSTFRATARTTLHTPIARVPMVTGIDADGNLVETDEEITPIATLPSVLEFGGQITGIYHPKLTPAACASIYALASQDGKFLSTFVKYIAIHTATIYTNAALESVYPSFMKTNALSSWITNGARCLAKYVVGQTITTNITAPAISYAVDAALDSHNPSNKDS